MLNAPVPVWVLLARWGWVALRSAAETVITELRDARHSYLFRRPVILLFVLIAGGIAVANNRGLLKETEPLAGPEGQRAAITGVIAGHPERRPTGVFYPVAVETVEFFGPAQNRTSADRSAPRRSPPERRAARGKVLVQVLGAQAPTAEPGDRIRAFGNLQAPPGARTLGAFDYRTFLHNRGIRALCYTGTRSLTNLGDAGSHRLLRRGWRFKQRAVRAFDTHLTPEQSTVLAGLVLGNRPRFNPEVRRIFLESGTTHVLVASGLNVAIVIGLWYLIARLLFRLPNAAVLITALPWVGMYVFVVGTEAPITRAAVMATAGVCSYLLARKDRPYQALAVAALVILIPSPRSLFDVSFQMSFVTVFGFIHTLPHLEPLFGRFPRRLRWPLRVCAATATAQLWLHPITAAVFGRYYPSGLIANVLIIPLSGFRVAAGAGLLVIDVLDGFLPLGPITSVVGALARAYVQSIIAIARFFADWPGITVWLPPPTPWGIAGFYLALLSAPWAGRRLIARGGLLLGVTLALFGFADRSHHPPPGAFTAAWVNVGRHESVVIRTPEGNTLLINPGRAAPVDGNERALLPFLAQIGVRRVDAVILTRPNIAVEDLRVLRAAIKIGEILICANAPRAPSEGDGEEETLLASGETRAWGGLTLAVLPGSRAKAAQTPVLITYADRSVVIAGDVAANTQRHLIAHPPEGNLILHARLGSAARWVDGFPERIRPKMLVNAARGAAAAIPPGPWDGIPAVSPASQGWFLSSENGE